MKVTISPCLWFDDQAEAAATFYASIFPGGRIDAVTRYPAVGQHIHGRPAGSVMTVEFEIAGMRVTALNGGPLFQFNEAVSLQVLCKTQEEIDYYWERLHEGCDDPDAGQCGWLKDRFGLSWQVTPEGMDRMLNEKSFAAMLGMKKLDIAALEAASRG